MISNRLTRRRLTRRLTRKARGRVWRCPTEAGNSRVRARVSPHQMNPSRKSSSNESISKDRDSEVAEKHRQDLEFIETVAIDGPIWVPVPPHYSCACARARKHGMRRCRCQHVSKDVCSTRVLVPRVCARTLAPPPRPFPFARFL